MYHIIYVSSARKLYSKEDLLQLLEKSRKNNARNGITGALFYRDGNFLQVIEGEEAAVKTLYKKIKADHDHKGIIKIIEEEIPECEFPDWKMAFYDFSSQLAEVPEGFSDFLCHPTAENNLEKYSDDIRAFLKYYIKNETGNNRS
jgi:hypothetical protein